MRGCLEGRRPLPSRLRAAAPRPRLAPHTRRSRTCMTDSSAVGGSKRRVSACMPFRVRGRAGRARRLTSQPPAGAAARHGVAGTAADDGAGGVCRMDSGWAASWARRRARSPAAYTPPATRQNRCRPPHPPLLTPATCDSIPWSLLTGLAVTAHACTTCDSLDSGCVGHSGPGCETSCTAALLRCAGVHAQLSSRPVRTWADGVGGGYRWHTSCHGCRRWSTCS